MDDAHFATEGIYFNATGHWYLHSQGYGERINPLFLAKADLGGAWRFSERLSAKAIFSGGFHLGLPKCALFFSMCLEDKEITYLATYSLSMDMITSVFGNYDFLKGEMTLSYRFYKRNYIKAIANIANAEDNMFTENKWFSRPKYTGYALGLSSDTIIGPIEVKATYSPETNKFLWLFNIGFWF